MMSQTKHNFFFLRIVILFFLSLCYTNASRIDFQSGADVNAFQSDGFTTLSSAGSGAFTFALGTFDESVLADSSDSWSIGFMDQMQDTNDWLVSPPVADRFLGEVQMTSGAATNQNAYILGYDTLNESQIILFKNENWIFPVFNDLDLESDIFSLQDNGTQMLLADGSFSNFTDTFTMISAVPEPSIYALFVGSFTLSYSLIRRSRIKKFL